MDKKPFHVKDFQVTPDNNILQCTSSSKIDVGSTVVIGDGGTVRNLDPKDGKKFGPILGTVVGTKGDAVYVQLDHHIPWGNQRCEHLSFLLYFYTVENKIVDGELFAARCTSCELHLPRLTFVEGEDTSLFDRNKNNPITSGNLYDRLKLIATLNGE